MGNDFWLWLSMAAGTAALVCAAVLCSKIPKREDCLFRYEETKASFGLTVLAVALGYGVEILKLKDPSLGGEEKGSYGMIAVLGLAAILMGAYMILYSLNRKIYVYEDELIVRDEFGKEKTVPWDGILAVSGGSMQQARFDCRGGFSFRVSASNRCYSRFMEYAEERMKQNGDEDLISRVEKNMM